MAKKGKKQQAKPAGNGTGASTAGSDPVSIPDSSSDKMDVDPPAAEDADDLKEQGNQKFKAKLYLEAIPLYTRAIELKPTEPAYLTNRAASYMALKRYKPALADCQQAAQLQAANPAAKTLLRLARCQLALASIVAASSTLRTVLSLEPGNTAAVQLQGQVSQLESHLRNFEAARAKKDFAMARLALDKCSQGIEGEGGDTPTEWRIWRIELELARSNWEVANNLANDAMRIESNSPDVIALRGLVLFLSGKLPQSLQHCQMALRLDPGHVPAAQLRKRVKDVERLKEEGNAAFKSARLQEAIDKYTEALERIGDKEEEGKGGQMRATILSNRATTYLKLNQHSSALEDTDQSLLLAPKSFKALRTRARINLHLEKYDQAVGDFKSALEQASVEGNEADVRATRTELKKAEADLKRSKTKDYYKILGVSRDATELEIKKGYRRESLKHHPDKGGDEEKFKLVVEANSVLSDPRRRERYDLGEDEDGMSDGGGGGPGGMGGMSQDDLQNLFAQFHGGGGGGGFGFGGGGGGGSRHSHGGGPFGF